MAEGMDIGAVDPALLALLDLMTSTSAGTNLNTAQDLFSGGSFSLPLSTSLGTLPFDYMQEVVLGSQYGSPVAAPTQAADIYDEYRDHPLLGQLLESVNDGMLPEQVIAEYKAELYNNAELTNDQRKAKEFELDGALATLKIFDQSLREGEAFANRVALGDVVERDGQFFEVVPEATRRANLQSQYGITGPLADLSMYGPSAETVAARDAAVSAADQFSRDRAQSRQDQLLRLGQEYKVGVPQAEKDQDLRNALATAARLRAENTSSSPAQSGAQSAVAQSNGMPDGYNEWGVPTGVPESYRQDPMVRLAQDSAAASTPSRKRNVLDDTTIAAMAGIANSRKPTQMSQGQYDSRVAEIDAGRDADRAEYDRMVADASKIGAGEVSPAQRYLEGQRALLAALATPQKEPEEPKVVSVPRPKVRLSSDQIRSIVGAIAR
jgi:hypothetical protein